MVCVAALAGGCVGERASDAGQWTDPPKRGATGAQPASGAGGKTNGGAGVTPEGASERDAIVSQVEQDMADLQVALEAREAERAAAVTAQSARARSERSEPGEARTNRESTADPAGGAAVIDGEGGPASANMEESIETGESASATLAPAPSSGAVEASLNERIETLRAELAASLEESARSGEGRAGALLALGALETMREGSLREEALENVGEEEAEALRAWAEMHREAARRAATGETDAGLAAARGSGWGASAGGFRVETALLCSKVEGFGRYETLNSSALLAGRSQRAIVYAELSDFAHRAVTNDVGTAGWRVELTQELSLYHDADQVLAWRRPEQTISDFSRNKRRDFFVVQMIELPSTLSIGAYNLKITMRDREAGAVSEAIIPIRVVADPALTRGGR